MIGAVATMVRPPPGPELRVLHNVTADDLIARGHAVLTRAAGDGLDWAAADIAGLQHLLDAPDRMAIWRHAHDLRGNAGTFGWMLALAHIICSFANLCFFWTIIAIPNIGGHWKLIRVAFLPFNKVIVPTNVAQEINDGIAKGKLGI